MEEKSYVFNKISGMAILFPNICWLDFSNFL
jgi:hypothetical protein